MSNDNRYGKHSQWFQKLLEKDREERTTDPDDKLRLVPAFPNKSNEIPEMIINTDPGEEPTLEGYDGPLPDDMLSNIIDEDAHPLDMIGPSILGNIDEENEEIRNIADTMNGSMDIIDESDIMEQLAIKAQSNARRTDDTEINSVEDLVGDIGAPDVSGYRDIDPDSPWGINNSGLYIIDETEDVIEQEFQEWKRKMYDRFLLITAQRNHITTNELPTFIHNIGSNFFEYDDHMTRGTCLDDTVLAAYSLGRKYSDYNDYLDAMYIYDEYIDYIEERYGAADTIQQNNEDGNYIVFIPEKPKLANLQHNRLLLRTGFIPSRYNHEKAIDVDDIVELVDLYMLDAPDNIIPLDPLYEEEEDEISQAMYEDQVIRERIQNVLNSEKGPTLFGDDTAFKRISHLLTYGTEDEELLPEMSFSEIIESLYDDYDVPEDIVSYRSLPRNAVLVRGEAIGLRQKMEADMNEKLIANGHLGLDDLQNMAISESYKRKLIKKYELGDEEMDRRTMLEKRKRDAQRMKDAHGTGAERLRASVARNRQELMSEMEPLYFEKEELESFDINLGSLIDKDRY